MGKKQLNGYLKNGMSPGSSLGGGSFFYTSKKSGYLYRVNWFSTNDGMIYYSFKRPRNPEKYKSPEYGFAGSRSRIRQFASEGNETGYSINISWNGLSKPATAAIVGGVIVTGAVLALMAGGSGGAPYHTKAIY